MRVTFQRLVINAPRKSVLEMIDESVQFITEQELENALAEMGASSSKLKLANAKALLAKIQRLGERKFDGAKVGQIVQFITKQELKNSEQRSRTTQCKSREKDEASHVTRPGAPQPCVVTFELPLKEYGSA